MKIECGRWQSHLPHPTRFLLEVYVDLHRFYCWCGGFEGHPVCRFRQPGRWASRCGPAVRNDSRLWSSEVFLPGDSHPKKLEPPGHPPGPLASVLHEWLGGNNDVHGERRYGGRRRACGSRRAGGWRPAGGVSRHHQDGNQHKDELHNNSLLWAMAPTKERLS